jgi:hypothetical protein
VGAYYVCFSFPWRKNCTSFWTMNVKCSDWSSKNVTFVSIPHDVLNITICSSRFSYKHYYNYLIKFQKNHSYLDVSTLVVTNVHLFKAETEMQPQNPPGRRMVQRIHWSNKSYECFFFEVNQQDIEETMLYICEKQNNTVWLAADSDINIWKRICLDRSNTVWQAKYITIKHLLNIILLTQAIHNRVN